LYVEMVKKPREAIDVIDDDHEKLKQSPQNDLWGKKKEFLWFFVDFDLDFNLLLFTVDDLFDDPRFLCWRKLHDGVGRYVVVRPRASLESGALECEGREDILCLELRDAARRGQGALS